MSLMNIPGKEIEMIGVELISENPFQPRKEFDDRDIEELSQSITAHGLIQPVILRKVADRYQVIAGERRLRAFKKLGYTDIPSIVVELDGVDVAEVSLIENLQRKNLNCIEEAMAFNIMKAKFGMTDEDIAKRIGKSRPYVSNSMRLLSLPDQIRDALFATKISMGHGRALLPLEGSNKQEEVFNYILLNSLSVRQTEEIVNKVLGGDSRRKYSKRTEPESFEFSETDHHYNEVKQLASAIRKKGVKVDIIERETDDYREITIRIAK